MSNISHFILAIASVTIQLIFGNPILIFSTQKNISIQATTQISITHSWQKKFEQKRRETEFLDDNTEYLLIRHQKWLILVSIMFVWTIYKSLWSSK